MSLFSSGTLSMPWCRALDAAVIYLDGVFDGARRRLIAARDIAYAPILEPGERLITTGLVSAAFIGSDDVAAAPSDTTRVEQVVTAALAKLDNLPPLPKGFVVVAGIVGFALSPDIGPTFDVERVLGGTIGHGAADSVAALFKSALGSSSNVDLVVTDRRLGLATDSDATTVPPDSSVPVAIKQFEVVVDRRVLVGVRRKRRPFEIGRLDLAFGDGSRITVTAGMVLPWRANRLFVALTSAPAEP